MKEFQPWIRDEEGPDCDWMLALRQPLLYLLFYLYEDNHDCSLVAVVYRVKIDGQKASNIRVQMESGAKKPSKHAFSSKLLWRKWSVLFMRPIIFPS